MEKKIVLKIDYEKPVEIVTFTNGLQSIANMYSRYADRHTDTKIAISEIEKGSIIVTLLASAGILFENVHPIILIVKNIKDIWNYWLNPQETPEPKGVSAGDYKDAMNTANISNQKGTVVQIHAEGHSVVNNYNNYVTMRENFNNRTEPKIIEDVRDSVLFYWKQTHFEKLSVGNKGYIQSISKKDMNVHFENEEVKQKMTNGNNWQNNGYIVDVILQRSPEDIIKVYKITKLHKVIED